MRSWNRIVGLIKQDFYIARHDLAVWTDLFFFSVMNILVFGLIAQYFSHGSKSASLYVLSGMLMWEVLRVSQFCFDLTTMMNVWSSNLANMFIAPISRKEFVIANTLIAAAKTIIVVIVVCVAARVVFGFNILDVGIGPLVLTVLSLLMFGVGLGLILMGFVFRWGVRIQALTWSAVALFQPLMGVYFPLTVLPHPIRWIAQAIPATHSFTGIHNSLSGTGPVYGPLFIGLGTGILFLAITYIAFSALHKKSMVTGQFARNDT